MREERRDRSERPGKDRKHSHYQRERWSTTLYEPLRAFWKQCVHYSHGVNTARGSRSAFHPHLTNSPPPASIIHLSLWWIKLIVFWTQVLNCSLHQRIVLIIEHSHNSHPQTCAASTRGTTVISHRFHLRLRVQFRFARQWCACQPLTMLSPV